MKLVNDKGKKKKRAERNKSEQGLQLKGKRTSIYLIWESEKKPSLCFDSIVVKNFFFQASNKKRTLYVGQDDGVSVHGLSSCNDYTTLSPLITFMSNDR